MSSKINPKLQKILSENVLSGDFKIKAFKTKLRNFLEYSTEQMNEMLPYSKDQVGASISQVISKSSASDFRELELPVPKCRRLWISIVYAVIVLNKEIFTDIDAKEHLVKRYGEKGLVFDPETLETCVDHAKVALKVTSSTCRKRKLSDSNPEAVAKRAKVIDAILQFNN